MRTPGDAAAVTAAQRGEPGALDALVAAYLPTGGTLTVPDRLARHRLEWFDPRTGQRTASRPDAGRTAVPPATGESRDDWVALFTRGDDGELSG